eukprot:tig00001576_g9368.t1
MAEAPSVPEWLQAHAVEGFAGLYIVPDFVADEQEQELIDQIYGAPALKWTQLLNRRLQNWGGLPHPRGMVPDRIPPWLSRYCELLHQRAIFPSPPNHVLINEYKRGQGIMPHEDGPLYYPMVATLNVAGSLSLDFYPKAAPAGDPPVLSLYARRRSLYVFTGPAYLEHRHGIAEREADVVDGVEIARDEARVSLTFRIVSKVLKTKIKL